MKNWHEKHAESLSLGDRMADKIARGIGSPSYIIIQTLLIIVWVVYNGTVLISLKLGWSTFDPYPFIFLNLVFSVLAAYATPFILVSENRQSARDRVQAQHDLEVNMKAESEIQSITHTVNEIHELLKEVKDHNIEIKALIRKTKIK